MVLIVMILTAACGSSQSADIQTMVSSVESEVRVESVYEEARYLHDLTVINETGTSFLSLSISPTRQARWRGNLLPASSLVNEDSVIVTIDISESDKDKMWDLQVINDQNCEIVWQNLDILSISEIMLSIQDRIPQAAWREDAEESDYN